MCGCGGQAPPAASNAAPQDKEEKLDVADVVLDTAGAETSGAPADDAPPPPAPGDIPPVPGQPAATAQAPTQTAAERLLANMTPAERADYDETQKGIKKSADTEASSNSVLVSDLQRAVEDYYADNRKLPAGIAELIKAGYLAETPRIPAGKKVRIDGKTMQVVIE